MLSLICFPVNILISHSTPATLASFIISQTIQMCAVEVLCDGFSLPTMLFPIYLPRSLSCHLGMSIKFLFKCFLLTGDVSNNSI
jgi:hypothetical protein